MGVAAGCIILIWTALPACAAVDWSRFRGPNGSGVAEATGLPDEFGPQANVVWKTALPSGSSSPVLTEDRIFLSGFEEGSPLAICLDRATGGILWRRKIPRERSEQLHQLNSPASSTPATDGRNAYFFFGDFGLVSYAPDGNERWRMLLGPFTNLHGMAASPILAGNKLILICDQDNDSYLLAVHKDTGKLLWKTARPEVVHGFATPAVFQPKGGAAQLIVPGSYQLISYSVESGQKLWWMRGITWQVKASPVVNDDTIYVTGWAPGADAGEQQPLPPFEEVLNEADKNRDGKISSAELPEKWKHRGSWNAIDLDRDGFLDAREWGFYRARRAARNATVAIRPGNLTGDLTDHVLWKHDRSVPQVSSPLLYEGLLYTIKDGGIFTSFDAETGVVKKQARLRNAIDNYYASPVVAGGKIFLASETGKIAVVRPGADWELLAVNDLDEPCYATPAIAGSRIYIRTGNALYCFGRPDPSGLAKQ